MEEVESERSIGNAQQQQQQLQQQLQQQRGAGVGVSHSSGVGVGVGQGQQYQAHRGWQGSNAGMVMPSSPVQVPMSADEPAPAPLGASATGAKGAVSARVSPIALPVPFFGS